MAVFHKTHKNMGLSAFGQHFQIGEDGKLSPDPDKDTAALFAKIPDYTVTGEPEKEPEKPAVKKSAPKKKKTTRKKKIF